MILLAAEFDDSEVTVEALEELRTDKCSGSGTPDGRRRMKFRYWMGAGEWITGSPDRTDQNSDAPYCYTRLRTWCNDQGGQCVPVAGSFVDRRDLTNRKKPKEERYLYWYKYYLGKKAPAVWSYHPYNAAAQVVPLMSTDPTKRDPNKPVKKMTTTMLREFLDDTKPLPGKAASAVWFTEAGPLYAGFNGNQKAPACFGKTGEELRTCQWDVGRDQLDYLTKVLPAQSSRIKRFFYYSFRGNADSHDSGIVDPAREGRQVDNRGTEDPSDDRWVYQYSRADQLRPTFCSYGAMSAYPFQFAAEGVIRACP